MTDDAPDADEIERAEAEALAAALDAQPSDRVPPEDALQTAMLMRHGGTRAELSSARSDAILAQLSAELPRASQRKPARVVRVLAWSSGLAAAAAIALALASVLRTSEMPAATSPAAVSSTEAVAAPTLPSPSARLLSAQTALLRGADPETDARFERELGAYRAQLFRSLQAAYPAKVGTLEPEYIKSGTAPALRGGALSDTAPALRGGALSDTAPALRGGAGLRRMR